MTDPILPQPLEPCPPSYPAILRSCPACGCPDLFIRKDFPQKLGLTLVAAAALSFLILAANPRTFYIGVWILIGITLIDALLYVVVSKITVCYGCRGEFRDAPINPAHSGFELAIAEKYHHEE